MQIQRMFVPTGNGLSIGVGDLFMVSNTKLPEYGVVFQCSGFDIENRICKWEETKGFHDLSVVRVALYECTKDVSPGDEVFVSYNVRFPGSITRHYHEGVIEESEDGKNWAIITHEGIRIVAPQAHTYKRLGVINNLIGRYVDRNHVGRRLRKGASPRNRLLTGVGE